MNLESARNRLAVLWVIMVTVVFVLTAWRTMANRFGGYDQQVWSWLLPHLLPTLSLVLGALGAGALHASKNRRNVSRTFYRVTMSLSSFYILGVWLVLASVFEWGSNSQQEPDHLLGVSNYFLGPIQGVVVGTVGIFYQSEK